MFYTIPDEGVVRRTVVLFFGIHFSGPSKKVGGGGWKFLHCGNFSKLAHVVRLARRVTALRPRRIYRAAPIPPRPAVAGCWLLLLALERGLVMDLDIDLGLDLNMGLDLGMDLDMDVDWIWIWV